MQGQVDPSTLKCTTHDNLCIVVARVMNRLPVEGVMTQAEQDEGARSAAERLKRRPFEDAVTLAALLLDSVSPEGESAFVFRRDELDLMREACRETGYVLPPRTLH